MVISCSAFGCVNRQTSKHESLSFHRFPHHKPILFKLWTLAVRRHKWIPTKTSYICSNHFKDDDFIQKKKGIGTKAKLKSDAVPSIFSFSNALKLIHEKAFTNSELSNEYPNHVLVSDDHVEALQQTKSLSIEKEFKNEYSDCKSSSKSHQIATLEKLKPLSSDRELEDNFSNHSFSSKPHKIRTLPKKPLSTDRELEDNFSNHSFSSKPHKIRTLPKKPLSTDRDLQYRFFNYSKPTEKHQIKLLQAQLSKLKLKHRKLMNINYRQKIVISKLNSQFKYLANELINGDRNHS